MVRVLWAVALETLQSSTLPSTSLAKVVVIATLVTFLLLLLVAPKAPPIAPLNVAFIGNSITFVNDIPRLMEALSQGNIRQNSCLHGSLNFRSILRKGNGMYVKWRRKNARLNLTDDGHKLYDFGACTVPQLLLGYDGNLTQGNANGYYVEDGKNPCFRDDYYYNYIVPKLQNQQQQQQQQVIPSGGDEGMVLNWDVVVMNDRTIYPALYETRQSSLKVLKSRYVDWLNRIHARPVLIMTYGYYTNASYSNQLGDIPEFTSHLYYGYQQYANLLAKNLPDALRPRIAPVGLAYLTIWEENYVFWKDYLFFSDGLHPSPHGSFLLGCTLFITLYGRLPLLNLTQDHTSLQQISLLFARARRMEVGAAPTTLSLPTRDQALYLLNVAERVVLHGHVPNSLLRADQVEALERQYINQTISGVTGT